MMFFIAFILYTYLAIYTFKLGIKKSLNRIFLFLAIIFAVWAFAFAAMNGAATAQEALLWRRISVIGWGVCYSVIFHFTLVLTNKKPKWNKWYVLLMIYLPSFLNIYWFGINTKIAERQYNIVLSETGWWFIPLPSNYDHFFNIYYLTFSIWSIIILIDWARRSKSIKIIQQVKWLVSTSLAALILGTITDILAYRFFSLQLPSLAPIFILIPVIAILKIVKKYGMLKASTLMDENENKLILRADKRREFFIYLSFIFLIGSLSNLFFYFNFPYSFLSTLVFSAILVIISALLYTIQYSKLSLYTQENIMIFIVGLSIPIVILRFSEGYGSNVVWPFPLILMILSAVFNRRRVLTVIGIITIATGVASWMIIPQVTITIDAIDHISRLFFYLMGFVMTRYINKTYVDRLSENEEHIEMQRMISLISADFINVKPENLNDKVEDMIDRIKDYASYKWHEDTRVLELVEKKRPDVMMLDMVNHIISDALAKIDAENEIHYLAFYDALTGLPNRTLLNKRIEAAIEEAYLHDSYIGIVFLDLDAFKEVNDTLGHDWGDELLKQVSKNLTENVRKVDTVARFGGDEFILLLAGINNLEEIQQIISRVMKAFSVPLYIQEQEFFVTTSAGIATYPIDGMSAEVLIKNADLAMYSAKDAGKNQYAFCSEAMKEQVMRKRRLTNFLHHAIDKNELRLLYQPQIDITTGQVTGVEALIRWEHPKLGMISPAHFIHIAEQTGLIDSIGEWVLKTACEQNKNWQIKGYKPIKMGVNLSVEQFRHAHLLDRIKRVLKETQHEPMYLELEITESIALKDTSNIINMLKQLKALGISIAIDDFGTEYSSLSRLKELPINRIKIAMPFIHGIDVNHQDRSITEVIIHLAMSLEVGVIAEGVETEKQLEFLRSKGCLDVQGYYYYQPLKADEVEKLLELRN